MNGLKAFASICLKSFVSKLPSDSHKYPSLTSSGVPCLIFENTVLMHQCEMFANDINPKAASPIPCAKRSFAIISFVYSDAPALPIASTQSMTFG